MKLVVEIDLDTLETEKGARAEKHGVFPQVGNENCIQNYHRHVFLGAISGVGAPGITGYPGGRHPFVMPLAISTE